MITKNELREQISLKDKEIEELRNTITLLKEEKAKAITDAVNAAIKNEREAAYATWKYEQSSHFLERYIKEIVTEKMKGFISGIAKQEISKLSLEKYYAGGECWGEQGIQLLYNEKPISSVCTDSHEDY